MQIYSVYIYICIYTHMHIYIYIYTCMCMYVYKYIYIYIAKDLRPRGLRLSVLQKAFDRSSLAWKREIEKGVTPTR